MHQPTHYSPTALSYARAVLELAEERKTPLDAIRQEINAVADIVSGDSAIGQYLTDPAIGVEARSQVIARAFSGKVSPLVYDFLRLLNVKSRLAILGEIVEAYGELVDEKLGKVEVDLMVAQKLTEAQVEEARKSISAALKRDAVVHVYVEEDLIGGAVLRIGDRLVDASVKYQLVAMKEKLLASRRK
jgi:F-type H+-transporting ATPase subunit delta